MLMHRRNLPEHKPATLAGLWVSGWFPGIAKNREIPYTKKYMRNNSYILGAGALLALGMFAAVVPLIKGDTLLATVASSVSNARTSCLNTINAAADLPSATFVTTKANINNDGVADLLVRIESPRTCGNTGCQYELCVSDNGSWTVPRFGYASTDLTVEDTVTAGYRDITLGNGLTMSWDGQRYLPVSTQSENY